MSKSGTKSDQGDDYQRFIALHWMIRLISDDAIEFVQAQSTGLPGVDEKITVDDIVVCYKNGQRRHIQAKKNQPKNRCWNLADLQDELPKILAQLKSSLQAWVELYSQTPFGFLKSLVDSGREYPDFDAFKNHVKSRELKHLLNQVAEKWGCSQQDAFVLLRRIEIGPHHSFEDWPRINLQDLQKLVSRADAARDVLEAFLNEHQSKLLSRSFKITREDVLDRLRKHGCLLVPLHEEAEMLQQFRRISAIGRNDWQRTVGGKKILRPEFAQVLEQVEKGAATVLVTDRPGSGKTCLLLDIADHLETDDRCGLLFIKGDRFTTDSSTADLHEDILGLCARLSEKRRVAVILDSLDVLSMNREHGTLEKFLRLLDQLQIIPGVTVIAACRSFDLKYDPLLRDRKWSVEVKLADFDYDQIVAPLLKNWNVAEHEVDAPLRELLRLPQNLRLFETVAQRGGPYNIRSVHELHEAYLDEAVLKNPLLGDAAMQTLRGLADKLLKEREYSAFFPLAEDIRRALVSGGVLHQDEKGKIGFCHQTLLDNLAAKSAFAREQTLADFIKSHPPFPFIRPAVRSFAFHLRTYSEKKFRLQLWAVFTDQDVAYHFKRLLAESLIEIIPDADDKSLINRLMQNEPELFRRFFWGLNSETWFSWLTEHWLPNLGSVQKDKQWHALFAAKLKQWQNAFPEEVLALWQRAFAEEWDEKSNLVWRAASSLDKFQHWQTSGVASLLELLLRESGNETDFLGKAISQYVAANDQGDDLLWRFITKDLRAAGPSQRRIQKTVLEPIWDIGRKLHCDKFNQKDFLEQRMLASEYLLDLVLDGLQKWADAGIHDYERKRGRPPYSVLLESTSWKKTHNQLDFYHDDNLTILIYIAGQALKHHSRNDTAWWKKNEPNLRKSCEEGILYLLILAYRENLEANAAGIAAMLSEKNLLLYGGLEHELGELAGASFHLLNKSDQELFQQAVLSLYDDEDYSKELWVKQKKYDYLVYIPAIFRFPDVQQFVEQLIPSIGSPLPMPRVYCRSINAGPIVPFEKLIYLSNVSLCRILSCYDALLISDNSNSEPDIDRTRRRWFAIERVLSEAAAYDPLRFFALLPELECQGLSASYTVSILQGIGNHLRYRFGNLKPAGQDWKHVEPPPDGFFLAEILIKSAEQFAPLWQDGHAISHILEACCEVVEDAASAERLVFLLFRLRKHPDPEKDEQSIFVQGKEGITTDDLQTDAINRVRGVAAGAATTLCNRLLGKEIEPPELLFPLLRHYALDPVLSVRVALLNDLHFLTHKRHDWGWQLFDDIFRDAPVLLWPLAGRQLYYQYREHFDKVAPCLARIKQEAAHEAGEIWGIIAALASLDGHLPQDSLFAQLEQANIARQWKGAAKVFAANIERHNDACMNGLRRILEREKNDEETLRAVSNAFGLEKNGKLLDVSFAVLFIKKMQIDVNRLNCSQLFNWIAWLAKKDAAAIEVCECLMDKLAANGTAVRQLWPHEPLLDALNAILREADESDDEAMINRAVRLQDQFLRMDIAGMEEFLEQAAKL